MKKTYGTRRSNEKENRGVPHWVLKAIVRERKLEKGVEERERREKQVLEKVLANIN